MSKTATKTRQPVETQGNTGTTLAPIDTTPANFKVKKRVTVPTLTFPNNSRICIQILEAIHEGKALKETRSGNPTNKMGPAQVAQVMSPDGEIKQLVFGTVLRNELDAAYPDEDYVNRWFVISKIKPKEGKKYATYGIDEIEDPT